jgi:hypothetical protein
VNCDHHDSEQAALVKIRCYLFDEPCDISKMCLVRALGVRPIQMNHECNSTSAIIVPDIGSVKRQLYTAMGLYFYEL